MMNGAPPSARPSGWRARLRALPRAWVWLAVTAFCWLLSVAIGVGAASLLQRQLPQVASLEDYTPPILTRVYAADGSLLRQFGQQRRIVVPLSEIPQQFREALVAVEDSDFYTHPGFDVKAMLRALWIDIRSGSKNQGGSTITQQLARDLFLHKRKVWTRKIKEAILSLQIEKSYTKDEILELYCNQIYFGHGYYGIETASRHYYGKPASSLSLDEAALLAGVVQIPESYSPIRYPERAKRRRNHVLRRMVAEGFLTPEQGAAAAERPVSPVSAGADTGEFGLYFQEEVRKDLMERFGEAALKTGLEIHTTLDPEMQIRAEKVLRRHLRRIDRERGFRKLERNVLRDDGVEPEDWEDPEWRDTPAVGETLPGVVLEAGGQQVRVRLGARQGLLTPPGAAWTGEKDLTRLLQRGDRTLFTVKEDPGEDAALVLTLDQEPEVEGGVVVLQPSTGRVLALVGGYDFKRSQFNRAVQARRAVGSAFKPILFAAALEQGLTPSDQIMDEPTLFALASGGKVYQPENYERDYWGLITLREALEHSRNIPAVKLLHHVGFEPVFDVARRLGINDSLKAYPSLALGATEITLLDITAAYGVLANGGLRRPTHWVERILDHDGREVAHGGGSATEAMAAPVAYVLTQMLQGAIRHGTGASIADFPGPVAGKTGTTDGHSDAWFIGYTPELAAGVWVGLDRMETIGRGQSGARVALPIWDAIIRPSAEKGSFSDFPRPPGVVQAPVDPKTGQLASVRTGCSRIHLESFVAGSEPRTPCGEVSHYRRTLPYYLQDLPLGSDLQAHLSGAEIDALLEAEPGVEYDPLTARLQVQAGGRLIEIPVRRTWDAADGFWARWSREQEPDTAEASRPAGPLLTPDPGASGDTRRQEWLARGRPGLDGQPPSLVIFPGL